MEKGELVGLIGEGCIGARKGSVLSRVEEEAEEFGARGDWEGVAETGTGQACGGVGHLIGRRRLCCCISGNGAVLMR